MIFENDIQSVVKEWIPFGWSNVPSGGHIEGLQRVCNSYWKLLISKHLAVSELIILSEISVELRLDAVSL